MYAQLGTISHGTMLAEDLIPTFSDTLRELMKHDAPAAMSTDWRDSFNKTLADADAVTDFFAEHASEIVNELFECLDAYSPPFGYFGALEGDGADYGFWIGDIEDAVQFGDAIKIDAGDELPPECFTGAGYVFSVTDHGNVTCFERDGKGWREVWAIV